MAGVAVCNYVNNERLRGLTRAWGDFVKRHRRVLIEKFGIQKYGVSSYSTIMSYENRKPYIPDLLDKWGILFLTNDLRLLYSLVYH